MEKDRVRKMEARETRHYATRRLEREAVQERKREGQGEGERKTEERKGEEERH